MIFANIINWAIEDAGIPVKAIAAWASVGDSTVRRWADGSDPKFSHVCELTRRCTDPDLSHLLLNMLVNATSGEEQTTTFGPLTHACVMVVSAGDVLVRVEDAIRDGRITADELVHIEQRCGDAIRRIKDIQRTARESVVVPRQARRAVLA